MSIHLFPRDALAGVLAGALSVVLASCSLPINGLSQRHELILILPEVPASWAALPGPDFELRWRGPAGEQRSALATPGSRLAVEVERGRPQALLASPRSAGRPLRPAGGLYPEALRQSSSALALSGREEAPDELSLDWEGGYAASVAAALLGSGLDPWAYDLRALASEAARRSLDPWLLPPLEVARLLVEGEFRITRFATPKRYAISLPRPGPWSPESPFEAASDARVAQLPQGLWRFLGPESELWVEVDGEGSAAWVLR